MAQTLQHPIPNRAPYLNPCDEPVIVSAGAPIVLSVWRGDRGAPTVVFLPGTVTHPLFYKEFLNGLHRRGLSVVGVHYQGHNVLDPSLPESLTVSRLPGRLTRFYRPLLATVGLAARIAPGLPVPFWAYLDLDRVCGQPEIRRRFLTDPLSLCCYRLGFLAELCTADVSGMRDGSIGCPVLVVAARGDPLVGFGYTRRVFDRIVAPAKELLVFEVDRHLLFNECVELVTDPLVDRIRRLVAAPTTAEKGGRDEPATH